MCEICAERDIAILLRLSPPRDLVEHIYSQTFIATSECRTLQVNQRKKQFSNCWSTSLSAKGDFDAGIAATEGLCSEVTVGLVADRAHTTAYAVLECELGRILVGAKGE